MAAVQAKALTEGLRAKLASPLPLETRCRLAANTLSCGVAVPHREAVVLDWLVAALRRKYREPGPRGEEGQLWRCLALCLAALPPDSAYDFSSVPDFLLDVLPEANLALDSVPTAVSLLLPRGAAACPASPSWPPALAALLRHPALLPATVAALPALPARPGPHSTLLLVRLSTLLTSHPHYAAEITAFAASLLFSDTSEYPALFAHLASGDPESKPEAGPAPAALLACLEAGADPRLVMAAAGDQEPALRLPLLALCSALCGGPTSLNAETAAGARLLAAAVPCLARLQAALCSALPLDPALEAAPGGTAGRLLQDILRHCLAAGGAGPETAGVLSALHSHHPQLLEPLVPAVLVQHLQPGPAPGILACLLDVLGKLRQLPKLASRLFLHLRGLEPCPALAWQPGDMAALAALLPALPRVQTLELWKSLNYHLASDCLGPEPASPRVATTCALLGPLLATLLDHSQLADHNLPSSLLPRIRDLVAATLTGLEAVLALGFLPAPHRTLLLLGTASLSDLVTLFVTYRQVDTFDSVAEFRGRVRDWLLDNPEFASEPAAGRLLQGCYRPGVTAGRELALAEPALLQEASLPAVFDSLPEPSQLVWARGRGGPLPAGLGENRRACALAVMALLERVNRASEELYIPSPELWTRPDLWTDLDGYLAKSLAGTLVALLHAEAPGAALDTTDQARLASLPLEHLPSVLRLGATLACLSQVLRPGQQGEGWSRLAARCLETSDIFRFVDTAEFLARVLALPGEADELVGAVAATVGRFTKTILDVDSGFQLFEDSVGRDGGERTLGAAVTILSSLSTLLAGRGSPDLEGGGKRAAAEQLAEKMSKYVVRVFKKRTLDNEAELDLLFLAAAEVVTIFAARGLGKAARTVHKLAELAFASRLPGWRRLLAALCRSQGSLGPEALPADWRARAWTGLASDYTTESGPLVRALLATVPSAGEMEALLEPGEAPSVALWQQILGCEVAAPCQAARDAAVGRAVLAILHQAGRQATPELPGLLEAVFLRSPPCLPPQAEALALGCLALAPPAQAVQTLGALAAFLSHRAGLSTRLVPLVTSLLRGLLPSLGSLAEVRALHSVLGLIARRDRADWAPVVPVLLADLLQQLPRLPADQRAALTLALLPLLPALDRHHMDLLSSSLSPASNELFKQLLADYQANHKFRGKV